MKHQIKLFSHFINVALYSVIITILYVLRFVPCNMCVALLNWA